MQNDTYLLINKPRPNAFNLNPSARLCLYILDKRTLVSQVSQRGVMSSEHGQTVGPTTFALILKLRIDSKPTGSFSSGHFRCRNLKFFVTQEENMSTHPFSSFILLDQRTHIHSNKLVNLSYRFIQTILRSCRNVNV